MECNLCFTDPRIAGCAISSLFLTKPHWSHGGEPSAQLGHGLSGDITSTVTSRALSLGPWLPPGSATAVSAAQERGHAASALVPAGSDSGGG